MRRIGRVGLAAMFVVLAARTLLADEADDMYQDIKKLGDQKLVPAGKKGEEFRAEAIKFFTGLVDRCEAYKKRFPDGANVGEVTYEEAKACFYLSRYSDRKKEDLETGAQLALKAIEIDPKVEAAAKARGLLIQYYKMYGKYDEVIQQAQAIVADFPESADAPLALRYIAEAYETMKKDKEATEAYEKLAKDYPECDHGKRAAGVLAARKLKGSVLELAFTSTAGEAVDVKTFKGRVVLVYFWASTDRSSISNLAAIASVEKYLHDRGLTVLGVSLDTDRAALDDCLKKYGVLWPTHNDGKKWNNELVLRFGVTAMPMTILVDRTGKVREMGLLGNNLIEAIKTLIDEKGK
jgi:tetratricopeptide (TPR) repeat protein